MTAILKVDTIQDTSGNNIINESSDTITIGASGDTTNIIGTLQNNGSALPSDFVKLATASASGASYISFDGYFTSDYRNYVVFYNNLFSSSSASTAYVRVRQGNADRSDSSYRFVTNFATRNSSSNNWYTNQGGWDVNTGARITADTLGDTESEAGQLMLNIFNPLSTASDTRLIGDLIYMRASDAELIRSQIQMEYNNTGACSGLTLYVDSGNISSTWTLYGIKKLMVKRLLITPQNPNGILEDVLENELLTQQQKFDASMSTLRAKRNVLLSDTDFYANSDVTMSSEMTTYRQALRDITNGLTTIAEVDAVTFPTKPSEI